MEAGPEQHTGWTFLTNHARVLATIADNPSVRIRDIAAHCRLTERSVQKIIADLEKDGYLSHRREGRTNTYSIQPEKVLRHPAEAGLTVASLLSWLAKDEADRKAHPDPETAPGGSGQRPPEAPVAQRQPDGAA